MRRILGLGYQVNQVAVVLYRSFVRIQTASVGRRHRKGRVCLRHDELVDQICPQTSVHVFELVDEHLVKTYFFQFGWRVSLGQPSPLEVGIRNFEVQVQLLEVVRLDVLVQVSGVQLGVRRGS